MPRLHENTAQTPESFHFVNGNPSSETERSLTRLLVRSHVGKWTWQQQLKTRPNDNEEPGPSKRAPDEKPPIKRKISIKGKTESNAEVLDNVLFVSSSKDSSPGRREPATTSNFNSKDDKKRIVSGTQSESLSSSYPILRNISIGNLNPSEAYLSSIPPAVINICNEYSLSVLWPALTPRSPHEDTSTAVSAWFPLSLWDETMFTAFLYGSLSHKRAHLLAFKDKSDSTNIVEKRYLDLCEIMTIRLLNQAIQDPTRATSDAVIMSVLCLAANKSDESVWYNEAKPPFQAPLRSLQWLDVYGSLSSHPLHAKGLAQLVAMRGGLQTIKLPGLAATISFSGLITASRTLSRPPFPYIPLKECVGAPTLLGKLGSCKSEAHDSLSALYSLGCTSEMVEVLHAMKLYTVILDSHHAGRIGQYDMCEICDQRNLIQHSILSLPTADELGMDFQQSHPVYEACRLVAAILGVAIVFPLPPQTAPLQALVRRLVEELGKCDFHSIWNGPDTVGALIWILVIGGIASTGLPERDCFVSDIARLTPHVDISNWASLKDKIPTYLPWLDIACDAAGQNLWRDVDYLLMM